MLKLIERNLAHKMASRKSKGISKIWSTKVVYSKIDSQHYTINGKIKGGQMDR